MLRKGWKRQLKPIFATDAEAIAGISTSKAMTPANVEAKINANPRGSLYIHEGAVNVDISAVGQGVYVKITGFTTGLFNNVTVNDDAFNVGKIGAYSVFWMISGDSQGNNKDYEVDIFVNGVEQPDGSGRREFATVASLGSYSGKGHINVADTSHDIDIRIKETGVSGGTDFDIFNMNFNIERIG